MFIADVHYKKGNELFLSLLKKWIQNPPVQVIFLGDIFHLLLDFKFLKEYNKEAIKLINILASKTEVYYTPGNHDFAIENIFENVVFADAFADEQKSVFLTHGDLTDRDVFYSVYVRIIRNKIFMKLLNFFTLNFKNGWLFQKILKKNIKCQKISSFKEKVFLKIADIKYKTVIEGHYHQREVFDFESKTYYALGAFVCDMVFYEYKNNSLKEITYEHKKQKSQSWFK